MNIVKLIAPALLVTLVGCGWVDSTGSQNSSSTTTATAILDPNLILLSPSDTFSIDENTQRTIVFNGPDNRISNWSWDLLEAQGNTDLCRDVSGFDQSIATNSLAQSCADMSNCKIDVEEIVLDNVTRFNFTTPNMRSPAALAYRFTAQTDSGVFVEQRQTLCAIPINNAPVPVDDRIVVTRGSLLQIDDDDPQNLLANDTDDVDVRNQPLRVELVPARTPRFASRFELFPNGGFIYEPFSDAPISLNGSISDSFAYSVTDGNETRSATVSIKINDVNTAPTFNGTLQDIEVDINDAERDPEIAYLQSFFTDAENDVLIFSALDGSLPESGNINLTSDGALEGFATDEDTGLYLVNFTVSDSLESIAGNFFLNIVRSGERNRAPIVTDINNRTVSDDFSYDVSVFFNDGDDDFLYFTAIDLPPDVEISANGVITGTANSDNSGTWLIRVKADDGNGGTTDDGFRLRIRQ